MNMNIAKCHCGAEAKLVSDFDPGERIKEFVECTNSECAMSGPVSKTMVHIDHDVAKAEAIAAWNSINNGELITAARGMLDAIDRYHTPGLEEEYDALFNALK